MPLVECEGDLPNTSEELTGDHLKSNRAVEVISEVCQKILSRIYADIRSGPTTPHS